MHEVSNVGFRDHAPLDHVIRKYWEKQSIPHLLKFCNDEFSDLVSMFSQIQQPCMHAGRWWFLSGF